MSDQLWTIETMLALSLVVLAWTPTGEPRWWVLGMASLLLGLTAITRSTIVPLLASLGVFGCLAGLVLVRTRSGSDRRHALAVLGLSLWTLLLGVGAVYGGTCWYNLRCYGFAGISALDSTEYKRFYLTLQSVGAADGAPYFPIDEHRRDLIARCGPTSAWLMGEMEKDTGPKSNGLAYYGRADFPTGWFHFAVFNVVINATHGNTRNTFALFRTIEGEIAQARQRGIVSTRVMLPLPDSRLGQVLLVFPVSLQKTVHQTLDEPPADWLKDRANPARYQDPDFTRALLRGRVNISPTQTGVQRLLAPTYAVVYETLPWLLGVALGVYVVLLIAKRKRLGTPSFGRIAVQLFPILFVVMAFWYALFDASGLPVLSRYMLFQHLLLPMMIASYTVQAGRLYADSRLGAPGAELAPTRSS